MGTRSNIGILDKNGTIRSIYCHWDGYPEYNGVMLHKFYNNTERVNKLLDLGDISSLKENLEPSSKYHSFENPEDNVTIAYHRDRNEDNVKARISTTIDDYRNKLFNNWFEFAYLFDEKNNKWNFLDILDIKYGDELEDENFLNNFKPLEDVLKEIQLKHPEDLVMEI